jgi:hypothetical protein
MKSPPKALTLALALALAALLAACGSTTTRTVTVTRTVPANTTTTTTSAATTTSHSPASTSTSTTTTATSGPGPSTSTTTSSSTTTATTTRTETGPAFVTPPGGRGALAAAVALLAHKGYTPVDSSTYRPADTLRVLIGRAAGGERAFFFDETTYLGTDASAASAHIIVTAQSDTEVVLGYSIYRPGAQAPSGVKSVHFALDMGKLDAIDSIPSVSQRR